MSNRSPPETSRSSGWLSTLRARGVLRVAGSYAVIAWLLLQIADVTFDPLGIPKWVMTALIGAAVSGLPIAIGFAWYYELGDAGVVRDTAADGAARPTVHGLRRYADMVVIAVLLVVVAVLLVRQSDLAKPRPSASPAIAVLPFENLSTDPEQEYFSDGLAAEVLDRLGRVPGLVVIARSSSFSFKGKNVDARTAARRLGVTTVLEGSVRRAGHRMKLSAQLIDGASGRQLWSGTFDRELGEVFAVQEDLASAVIEAIVPAARGDAAGAATAPTTDVSAYDLYLLGRQAQEARTGERLRESVRYLEQAVNVDPSYAKAHAAMSRALILWTHYQHVTAPADALGRAESEAHRALALDADSSEAHAALATVMREKQVAGAEGEYQRALELNPNNVVALWDYAVLLGHMPDREADARKLRDRTALLDPRSGNIWASRLVETPFEPDRGKAFRALFGRGLEALEGDADALNQIARVARIYGYAPEALRASYAIERAGNRVTGLKSQTISWLLVDDLDRARNAADALGEERDDVLAHRIEIAGLQGDYAEVERLTARLKALQGDDPSALRPLIFWLAAQGRYAEAATQLAVAGPIPEDTVGPLGSSLLSGLALPAVLRIYRATGRSAEADAMAEKYLQIVRADEDLGFVRPVLAANEGYKDEAVAALERESHVYVLSRPFQPGMPWFRNLEGHPGYDKLLAERQRRIDVARAEMLEIEAAATSGASGHKME